MRIPDAVRSLDRDLRQIFGPRLQSVVAYRTRPDHADATATLVVVDEVSADDLRIFASHAAGWHDQGLETPLILAADEFARSLDVFPLEFGAILAEHLVLSGPDPFTGLAVERTDLRRACEVQARSHLLHLREGYVETRGRSDVLVELIARSAAPLSALLNSVARLQGLPSNTPGAAAEGIEGLLKLTGHPLASVVSMSGGRPVTADEAKRLFPNYLDAVQRLTRHVDRWDGA